MPNVIVRIATVLLALLLLSSSSQLHAVVTMPALFTDHAVFQRGECIPVWGKGAPDEKVTVTIADQKHTATTAEDGKWQVTLRPLAVGQAYSMVIEGKNRLEIKDIQVGDVWLCSGQSNMEWSVDQSRDSDVEIVAADFPEIRLITVASNGSQTPADDFPGHWELCSPESVREFSAVGYFFGREMHQFTKVPIGLIDNSWGGSACEAWIRRDLMEGNPLYDKMIKQWDKTAADFDEKSSLAKHNSDLAAWKEKAEAARRVGEPDPPGQPWCCPPTTGQLRPSNLYNGRLRPIIPYAIRGVIWYQGESNIALAQQYRDLFPLMIRNWREEWHQGDLPFFFVQLADFGPESNQPGDSAWSELREAQTLTFEKTPYTGQAVSIDLGEANDVHPKNKQGVARRLARLALAKCFGQQLAYQSARYK